MPKSSLHFALQFSIRLIKYNNALDSTVWFENPDLTKAKARSASSVVNRLLLIQEHRLHARRLIDLPAVPKWSDFDDRHVKAAFAFWFKLVYLFA